MIPIYYKSSEGEIVNLIQTPYRMLTETDLLNSEWETTTVGENFPHITRLDKKLVSPKFSIRVTGSTKSEMANNLEHLESVFDRDCFLNQMGRLYIGEFYRECFITGITHGKVFEKSHTVAEYVATSNDGYWVSNKEISFSGSGALVGEIADKVYVSASHRNQDIIYTPQADHTAHLEYPDVLDNNGVWLRFDLGSVTNIGEFSGITVSRPTATPVRFDLQISSGEVVDDTRTISATSRVPTDYISVNDFEELVIDDTGLSTNALMVIGLGASYQEINRVLVEEGETVDVSAYRYIQFETQYASEGVSSTVTYTVSLEQWETIEQYDLSIEEEVEVIATDIECSSIRMKGSHFGTIDSDVSVVSDEQAQMRNLFRLGYQLENLTYSGSPVDFTFRLQDATQYGYVYFDDENVLLKSISTNNVLGGGCEVQGLSNKEWVKITDITAQMSETYNTHYDQIRLVKKPKTQSPLTYDYIRINIGVIGVITDAKVYNESYAPSNAIIEISEMPNNPSVVIGGVEYGADIELSQGHKLVIDTKKKTVRDYADDVSYENVYASRMLESFTPIETGENEVTWGGNAEIKITLEQARSIPKWN